MRVFHSERTKRRHPATELAGGRLVAPFESPARVDMIAEAVRDHGLGPVVAPPEYGLAPIHAVHDADYVAFLSDVWDRWRAAGHAGEAIATTFPGRTMREDRVPQDIAGRLGYYAMAAETSIDAGTFEAARASADIALAAVDYCRRTDEPAFGLCRPPGHHASRNQFGGYCFFNNAAIAAQRALDDGAARVAIVDVDYHHGNGTQSIFYDRADVLFVSLHADPAEAFPYFLGYADETGRGAGAGYNINYPLPRGTGYGAWSAALDRALARVASYRPDLLIVSLGVDTFVGDPISAFRFESRDFAAMGARLAQAAWPTVFLMEGGYAVADIGINVVATLRGFLG